MTVYDDSKWVTDFLGTDFNVLCELRCDQEQRTTDIEVQSRSKAKFKS